MSALTILATCSLASAGAVRFVDADAPPGGDGQSWETAYRFLQDALAEAELAGVREIRIAEGRYKPDVDEGDPVGGGSNCCFPQLETTGCDDDLCTSIVCSLDNYCCVVEWDQLCADIAVAECDHLTCADRTRTFALPAGLAVRGGFAGLGAKDPDARDPKTFETILTGDLSGTDDPAEFPNGASFVENAYSVLTVDGGAGIVLEGLTISGGHGNKAGGINGAIAGGALISLGGEVSILECDLTGNIAVAGGAIANIYSGTMTIHASRITDNRGARGGAVINFGTLHVEDCDISGNRGRIDSETDGGFAENSGGATLTMVECRFSDNMAVFGGALYNLEASAHLSRCSFEDNVAFVGAGLYSRDGTLAAHGCTFTGNAAIAGGTGGAVHALNTELTLVNCLVHDNTAEERGAGVSAWGSVATIVHCTIAGNGAGVEGAGIFSHESVVDVRNSILWSNQPDQVRETETASTSVRFTTVQGGWPGPGVLTGDPLFADAAGGDFRPTAGSPVIDAGHNWLVPLDAADADGDGEIGELLPFDLDGGPRVRADAGVPDDGCGAAAVVDMGPYESHGQPVDPVLFADVTGDAAVDVDDLVEILLAWGACDDACCLTDLDLNGTTGVTDLTSVIVGWNP